MKTIVIVGGMAAGCKTAARLKRIHNDCRVIIIEKQPLVSFGACGMPYYASGEVEDFLELSKTPWGIIRDEEYFRKVKDVEVLTETEVLNINAKENFIECRSRSTNGIYKLNYDYLVICTGAIPMVPSFDYPDSERVLTFHNPMDAKLVRELAQKGGINSAVIIGGGYIGCELAEALTVLWGIETTIIERENRLLFRSLDKQISNILEKRIIEKGISLILSATVHRIGMDGSGRFEIFIEGEGAIKSDIVFFCTGVKPDSKLAQDAGIKTGRWGGIVVNQFMQTSVENIYAGGDCIEILNEVTGEYDYFPLGSLANRQGKVIADSIARNLRQESDLSLRGRSVGFSGAVGAVSMKVYDLIVASTGITEARAKELHIETGILCASFYDRPHYHPDNRVLYAKVVYEVPSLRLLGLQLAGEGEVTRYIDLFSYLLLNGLDSYTLLNLEHAYNPPHSSPINPLNFIGSMIIAQEEEGIEAINPFTFRFENFEGQILELREESEIKSQPYCDSAICIPSDELRERYRELDKGIPLLAVCQKGPRAYEAVRFLKSQSYEKVFYLAGGVGMLGD